MNSHSQTRIAHQLRDESLQDRIQLYHDFDWQPKLTTRLRKAAGVLYESVILSSFTKRITLTLRRMEKCTSLHRGSSTKGSTGKTIIIEPLKTIEYSDNGLDVLLPDIFYIPEKYNQTAIESSIYYNGKLYVFQFNPGGKYGRHECGILKVASKFHVPAKKDWRFVFIVPPTSTLKAVDLQGFDVYSSTFRIERIPVRVGSWS